MGGGHTFHNYSAASMERAIEVPSMKQRAIEVPSMSFFDIDADLEQLMHASSMTPNKRKLVHDAIAPEPSTVQHRIEPDNQKSTRIIDPLVTTSTTAQPPPVAVSRVAVVPKRRRGRQIDWEITILTPQTFKTFLFIIYRVLVHCPFQLLKTETFTGLRVDSMDATMVCMIKASYECEIETYVDLAMESFTITTETFSTLLKDVQTGHILTLTRYSDSADLTVNSYARDDRSNQSTCTLAILDEECTAQELRMPDITYNYMVEMELSKLKSYCKIAHEINSSHMEFRIDEPVNADNEATTELFFTVGASSEVATYKKVHYSTTRSEVGSASVQFYIKSVTSENDEEVDGGPNKRMQQDDEPERVNKYNEIFSTNYLNLVLKSMDRQTVQLYMSKSLPLVIKYSLGNDQSHIQVILAPRLREEDT